jgi:hypothetical protein
MYSDQFALTTVFFLSPRMLVYSGMTFEEYIAQLGGNEEGLMTEDGSSIGVDDSGELATDTDSHTASTAAFKKR